MIIEDFSDIKAKLAQLEQEKQAAPPPEVPLDPPNPPLVWTWAGVAEDFTCFSPA